MKKILLIAVAIIIVIVVFLLARQRAAAPTQEVAGVPVVTSTTNLPSYIPSDYRLPVGQPHINGPSGPPPNY